MGRGYRVEEDQTNAEEEDEKKEMGEWKEVRDGWTGGKDGRFF